MSKMLGRVAKAIWDDRFPHKEWNDEQQRDYMGHARAAIESMWKPTDADFNGQFGEVARRQFSDMIDEILK